jgi:hypothetical protein
MQRNQLTSLPFERPKQIVEKKVSVKVGPGFAGCLTILFVALKLTGHIAWSWWWVLSPLWIGVVIVWGIWCLFFMIALIIAIVAAIIKR